MNAKLEDDNYRLGFQLGKLYAEIYAYVSHQQDPDDNALARTLLATLDAMGDIPEAHPAVHAALEAWDRDLKNT